MITVNPPGLVIGMDAGGTQICALSNRSEAVFRIPADLLGTFSSLEEAIYFITEHFGKPEVLVIGAAGPVIDGSITLTNRPGWSTFDPKAFGKKIGCKIRLVNDMTLKAAGLSDALVKELHKGSPVSGERKSVITVSTGVGQALLLPSGVIVDGEGGHPTWQPADELEMDVLRQLQKQLKTRLVSVEEVLGGSKFMHLYDALEACGFHMSAKDRAYIEACRAKGVAIGPFITRTALEDDFVCRLFMRIMGSLLGQYLRNVAVLTKPLSGIYLTGGVMQPEVVEYLLANTPIREAFLGGREHNGWLELIPWYLVTDPDLGVKGALALAEAAL